MATFKGSTDQFAIEDAFGIGKYITGLCSFVMDCETPLTIAIQGDWGSGKTSVMAMVQKKLAEDKQPVHCVWFNTWQYSQFNTADSLSLSLIDVIVSGLGLDGKDKAKNLRDTLGRVGSGLANLGKRVAYGGAEFVMGSVNTEDLRKYFEKDGVANVKDLQETIGALKEQFNECVAEACAKKNVDRVLVFIDDLDRLQPLRAVELLEVLKIFLDCEKCVFVLALDYNVVVSGVKSKYGEDFKADKGRSFFDKIIQVPFKMPVAQYDISSFVKKTFEAVAGGVCEETDAKNLVAVINKSIGSNPRSMKWLFNSFLLLLKVVGDDVQDDNSKKILFAVLCMQQHFEVLYNHIVMSIEELNVEFFEGLASEGDIEALLDSENISGVDTDAVVEFMKSFNKVLCAAGTQTIDERNLDILRVLLKSSSITSTRTTDAPKKRASYSYKGEVYKARGGNKKNLGYFALRLLQDYAQETDKTADEFMELINASIPCHYSDMKKEGWRQIEPYAKIPKHLMEWYFTESGESITIKGEGIVALRGWGAWEIGVLIDILGFEDKVTAHV